MADSEKSFADRLGRGRDMQAFIAGFSPVFAPSDTNLGPSAFNSYLNGVEQANSDVSTAEADSADDIAARLAAAQAVQDKALRVKNFVGANVEWKKYLKNIERAANAVRGVYKLPKAPVTPPGGDPPPVKKSPKGSRSQQGFADIEKNFDKLIEAVKKITGYSAPVGSGLQITELTAQHAAFMQLNKDEAAAGAALTEAQRMRKEYYDGEGGLREKMLAIKKATLAQYGSGSTQYASIKGIKP